MSQLLTFFFVDVIFQVVCPAGKTGRGGNAVCQKCVAGRFQNIERSTSCKSCPTGWSNSNNTGSVSCIPCATGKFSSEAASISCTDCPTGFLQDKPRQSMCKVVAPGKVVADGGGASIDVPLGSKILCDANTGVCSSFQPCDAGTYGEEPPSQQCRNCPAGWTSTNGATTCAVCDKGKYSDGNGGIPCVECKF